MPKCNVCKTTYGEPQRQVMLSNNLYWCAFCDRVYKMFNPVPAEYFSPERDVSSVIQRQKERYDFGKSTGWYKN